MFQNTYLSGWLIAFVLALIGVIVVARDQDFRERRHEIRSMFVVAPVVALAAAVSGFAIAHHADYPPGQMTVAILCLFLGLAWLYRAAVSSLPA